MDTLLLAPAAAGPAAAAAVDAARAVLGQDGAVEVVAAATAEELDAALRRRAERRLVVAGNDPDLHLVVRRLWRGGGLAAASIGLVPLGPGAFLAWRLHLPPEAAAAARVILAGCPRELDLIRSDGGGGVAVSGVRVGDGGDQARAAGLLARLRGHGWPLHVNVDDDILADGSRRLVAVEIAPGNGLVDVTVRGPAAAVTGTGGQPFRYVRRARGRAVTVSPAPGTAVPVDVDGVPGELRGRRSWWVEPGAWSVIAPTQPA